MLELRAVRVMFTSYYGHAPTLVVRAPGRVNLLGEHTDYNDGFVLPAAIERAIYIAVSPRQDRFVHSFSLHFLQHDRFSLDSFGAEGASSWAQYIRGVVAGLQKLVPTMGGVNIAISGDLPMSSGLSSSAALELGVAYAIQSLFQFDISREQLARIGQEAEWDFVGVKCGIMDQMSVAFGKANHALWLDCRTLRRQSVSLPADTTIVICDSKLPRTLAASAYNQRRAECAQAVEILRTVLPNITALRDVSSEDLQAHEYLLPEPIRSRARHVVSENERVLHAVPVLQLGDSMSFGQLMNESHFSLSRDYAVSTENLDTLTEVARRSPGCYGSRLTGAGFGGCTVSMVNATSVQAFIECVRDGYQQATGIEASIFATGAMAGVERIA